MKINEIVSESYKSKSPSKATKLPKGIDDSLPGVFVHRGLKNSDAYMQYRYGLAVASARAVANGEVEFSKESAFADNLTQVMYSSADEETIKMASKLFGVSSTKLGTTKSQEKPNVNKASPVAKKKKNKYGV